MDPESQPYDAVLVVSFGGPEGPDEVLPFLENVLRGKNVPRERMLEVVGHYQQFGGISPINQQCRELIASLEAELSAKGINLPIYWGNRNWKPMLEETLSRMADDGIRRAIAYFTSTFSSYSGCRQYWENIADAQQAVGPTAPQIDKLRMAYNHPLLVEANAELLAGAMESIPSARRASAQVLFSAHSIPLTMAENCCYEHQLQETNRLIAQAAGHTSWELVYQSRSGPPQQPWLEPDIGDRIEQLHATDSLSDVVVVPIGFVSDHIEVLFDLDTEAQQVCERLGLGFRRVPTVGTHPKYVRMLGDLIGERIATERGLSPPRPALGADGPCHDVCADDCCLYKPTRPTTTEWP